MFCLCWWWKHRHFISSWDFMAGLWSHCFSTGVPVSPLKVLILVANITPPTRTGRDPKIVSFWRSKTPLPLQNQVFLGFQPFVWQIKVHRNPLYKKCKNPGGDWHLGWVVRSNEFLFWYSYGGVCQSANSFLGRIFCRDLRWCFFPKFQKTLGNYAWNCRSAISHYGLIIFCVAFSRKDGGGKLQQKDMYHIFLRLFSETFSLNSSNLFFGISPLHSKNQLNDATCYPESGLLFRGGPHTFTSLVFRKEKITGCFQIHHQAYQLTINLKHVSWTQKRIQRFGDLAILESPGRRFFFQKGSVSWGSHRCWFDGNSQQSRLFSRMVWDPNRTALGGCDLAIDTPKCIRKDTSHTWILRVWDFLCQFLGSTPLTQDLTPRHHQDDDWNWLDF